MLNRRLKATAAGGLLIGLVVVPMYRLHAQGTAPGTGATPGQTSPNPNAPNAPTDPGTVNVPTTGGVSTVGVTADGKLIRDVITDDLLESRLGQIAQQKAVNPSVKQFAQRMISDHSRMQSEWTSMAAQNGMSVNPQLDNSDKAKVDQLNRLSGTAFDQAYMNLMIQGHQDALNLLQNDGQYAQSTPVRARVANDLPIVRQHLLLAQQVGAQVGATAVATSTPTTSTPTNLYYPTATTADANVKADNKFIREVAADNKLEVDLGQLAQTRGQNSEVKQFGQRMVADHNRLQSDWLNMASSGGLPLNPSYGKNHRKKVDQLQKLSGTAFDRAYMTLMIQDHKDYVDYFRKEGSAAHSTQVRNLVSAGLPTLEQHWNMAKQIGVKVGANPNATSSKVSN